MMAHFKEEEPCNTGTLSLFVIYLNRQNLEKICYFNLTSVFLKTESKFEKKTQCYVVKQLFLFEMSPESTM